MDAIWFQEQHLDTEIVSEDRRTKAPVCVVVLAAVATGPYPRFGETCSINHVCRRGSARDREATRQYFARSPHVGHCMLPPEEVGRQQFSHARSCQSGGRGANVGSNGRRLAVAKIETGARRITN